MSGRLRDGLVVESNLTASFQRASFSAATSRHSGDWLLALPITSCGLHLDDEAVRVAVVYGFVCRSVYLISAAVVHWLMLTACTALSVKWHQAERLGIMH